MLTILKYETFFKIVNQRGETVTYSTWDEFVYESTIKLLILLGINYEVIDRSK